MNKPKRSSDYSLGEYTKAEGRTPMVVGDVTTAVDVLVLGAGPGGYVAAIRAAQRYPR
jgi:NADPH-dependent 2,4-dienoyl-CoA reductase/sulfur reductase-like enzyme